MKRNNLVSIIVPAYNCEKTITKCLNSINEQDYECVEIIVINDGSEDSTGMIIKKYCKNPKFKIMNKSNEGVSATRNLGVKEAKGDYIIFIDADDYIEKNFVSTLVKMQNVNKLSLCGCFIKRCTENGNSTIIRQNLKYQKKYFVECLVNGDMDGFIFRYIFKKEILKEVFFDEDVTYMEDTMFLLKYLSASNVNNIVFTKDTNYIYLYQSSNSVTNNEKFVKNNIINMSKSLNQIYFFVKKKFDIKGEEMLIRRKAKLIEYCFSKIK